MYNSQTISVFLGFTISDGSNVEAEQRNQFKSVRRTNTNVTTNHAFGKRAPVRNVKTRLRALDETSPPTDFSRKTTKRKDNPHGQSVHRFDEIATSPSQGVSKESIRAKSAGFESDSIPGEVTLLGL